MTRYPVWFCLLAAGCSRGPEMSIEQLGGSPPAPGYSLKQLSGVRDGEVVHAAAEFTGADGELALTLRFRTGVPTRLESGTWVWTRGGKRQEGRVSARTVEFLGGQSGRPSLGGVYDLLPEQGEPAYRVRWPATELAPK
ncbi:MAG: hypothetical protein K2X35_13420 [Bryobacteraceae bacterium]|nr:hypothetical protein [Bryobacteraceae bacterium]